jgi:hypothetical protein
MKVEVAETEVVWSDFAVLPEGRALDAEFRFNPRQYRAVIEGVCTA